MNLDFNTMTPHEAAFVKAYAIALNREYDVFIAAMNMMRSDELAIRCPLRATELAWKLRELQANFDSELTTIAAVYNMKNPRQLPATPSLDDLIRVIRVSFFKLIEPGAAHKTSQDKGWFSGHPIDWKASWKTAIKTNTKQAEHPLTAILNAFLKLFEPPSNDYNPKNLPWFGKNPYKGSYDYEYEDDDDEEYDDQ